MRTAAKWSVVAAAVLAAILAGGYAYVASIDVDAYRDTIAQAARDATGREVTIGAIELEPSLTPRLVLERVTFANAAWGREPNMVEVERFEAVLELVPLLSREIRVRRLVVERPTVHLETDPSGVGNWSLGLSQTGASQGGSTVPAFSVERIDVSDARFSYRDGATGEARSVRLDRLTARAPSLVDEVVVSLEAALGDAPLRVEGRIGAPRALLDNAPLSMVLTLTAGGAVADIDAVLARPLEAADFEGTVKLAVTTLGDLDAYVGSTLPATGPARLSGTVARRGDEASVDLSGEVDGLRAALAARADLSKTPIGLEGNLALAGDSAAPIATLTGWPLPLPGPIDVAAAFSTDGSKYVAQGLSIKLGRSDLTGDASLDLGGERPKLEAALAAALLVLEEAPGSAAPGGAPTDRVFSAEPLPLAALRALDASVDLRAQRVEAAGHRFDATTIAVRLERGRLSVVPAGQAFGGTMSAEIVLDAALDTPALSVTARGRELTLGVLVNALAGASLLSGGPTDLELDVSGKGVSVAEIMGSLDGRVLATAGAGSFDNGALAAAGGGAVLEAISLISPFAGQDVQTRLDCAVVRLDVRDGVARTDKGLALETDKVTVVGSGTVDLGRETVDIGIAPNPREGIGLGAAQLAGLVRIGGTLSEPTTTADAAGLAGAGATVGAALATGGLSLIAQGLLSTAMEDPHPCATALGRAVPKARAAVTARSKADEESGDSSPGKETGADVTEAAKELAADVGKGAKAAGAKVGEAAKDVTESIGGALKGLFSN